MSRNESLGLLSIGSFLFGWFTYFVCYWPGDPSLSPLERFLATVFLLGAPGAYLVSIGTRYLTGYIPPPFSTAMMQVRIRKLPQLQERGVPTDEEYRRQGAALLSNNERGLVLLTFLFMVLFFVWHYALRHSVTFFLAPLALGLMPAALASRHVQRRFSLSSSVALGTEGQHSTELPPKAGNTAQRERTLSQNESVFVMGIGFFFLCLMFVVLDSWSTAFHSVPTALFSAGMAGTPGFYLLYLGVWNYRYIKCCEALGFEARLLGDKDETSGPQSRREQK